MAAESRTGGRSGLLNQVCTSAALDAALDEMDREYELQRRHLNYSFDDASSSDLDSFVSALDVSTQHFHLYLCICFSAIHLVEPLFYCSWEYM